MGFDLAKQGLNLKMGFKTKFGLILENQKNVNEERRRGEEEEEEEEEEEKKKRRGGVQERFKGMDSMIFGMELVYICMDTCLWVVGCEKPNPKMSSCMEIIINPFFFSRVLL